MHSKLRAAVAGLLLGFLLACGGAVPLTSAQQEWAGTWVAIDGTNVQIYLDGKGNYHGSNSNIDGGNATIDADTLTIGVGPIKKQFHVDAPPTEADGGWTVILDGIEYTKQ